MESYADSQVEQSRLELKETQTLNFWSAGMPTQVLADERLVVRCVRNLITNSIKYAGEEAIIDVLFYPVEHANKPYMALVVQDNGKGIADNRLKIVFEPFARLESSRDKKAGGYGLGLAIVQESMQLMGGMVNARNRKGGGLHIELLFNLAS
ncbi:sensor histidine kinase [Vibrio ponticus]|nr:sensor histidine kinase [Vibrio ponticus]